MESKIVIKHDAKTVLQLLDKALIEFDFLNPGMFGFIGTVNNETHSFWIVNHTHVFRNRSGLKFKTFRRFEGHVHSSLYESTIEGCFKIRPIFKVPILLMCILCLGLVLLALFTSDSLETTLKLVSSAITMGIFLYGFVVFNISKTSQGEKEIIEFIEDVLKTPGKQST